MKNHALGITWLGCIFSLILTLTLSSTYADGSAQVNVNESSVKDKIVNPNMLMRFEHQVIEALPLARAQIEKGLGLTIPHITVHLSPTKAKMREQAQFNHKYTPPAWSAGLAYPKSLTIYLPEVAHKELLPLVKHELIHIALGQRKRLPLWVNEGIAVALGDRLTWERLWTLNEAAANGTLIRFKELKHTFPKSGTKASIAYAQAAHFIHRLRDTQGIERFERWINALLDGESVEDASKLYFKAPFWTLERQWRKSLERGPVAWLSMLMKSENIWTLAILIFVIGGFKRLRSRRLVHDTYEAPLKIKVARTEEPQRQSNASRLIFHLHKQMDKKEKNQDS